MKGDVPTISNALSKDVKSMEEEWGGILKSALYFHDLMYGWTTHKLCSDYKALVIRMPWWRRSKNLNKFYAADRMSLPKSASPKIETNDEVLEVVLSKQYAVGARFSRKYTVLVESPEKKELVPLPPPPPKGTVEQIKDSVQQMLALKPSEPELPKYRMVPVDPQVFEIHLLDGPIRSHPLNKTISVLSRRANADETRPYAVEFHISQKAWHERLMIWMDKRADDAASAALESHSCGPSTESFGSSTKQKDKLPSEIEVVNHRSEPEVKPKRKAFQSAADGIWISDFDVVVGVRSDVASTLATEIMKRRVVPFFGSKKDLRPTQVNLMLLMLQEELKDEEKFRDFDLPVSNFWVKLSECCDKVRRKENLETKWLKKENGDFMGPFVHATENQIFKAMVDWVKECGREQARIAAAEEPKDPEPTIAPIDDSNNETINPVAGPESASTTENAPNPSQEKPMHVSFAPGNDDKPQVFNLTGPISTLDQKAKEVCQKWVDDSETLLVKAAKKTLIDSFQGDFNSFLFLFQLQLKRIKGGTGAIASGSDSVGGRSHADDTSWVSAEPSVEEEDTRVADIEAACIAFLNQMGNSMVKHYERLSGDKDKASPSHQIIEAGTSSGTHHRMSLDEHFRQSANNGVRSKKILGLVDPALLSKDGMSKTNPADTSLTLSEASTVHHHHQQQVAGHHHYAPHHNSRRLERPPRCPKKRYEEEEEDRDDYSEEDEDTLRSEPTYDTQDESLEETLDSIDDEDEPSLESAFESKSRRRHNRWRRYRDHHYDYDSPDSHTYDGESTIERESTSITLSPSDLSLDESPKPPQKSSWFGGILG